MAVTSVFGRTGVVTAAEGDYDLDDLGDVTISSPSNLDIIAYSTAVGGWLNAPLVAGADTQIIFNDGGAFGGDAGFVWDKTNNKLGIGTDTPSRNVTVYGTGAPLEGIGLFLDYDSSNAYSRIWTQVASGTNTGRALILGAVCHGGSIASPTATPSGARLVEFLGGGHDGSGFATDQAGLRAFAGSLWNGTNRETYFDFLATPSGQTSSRQSMVLRSGGILEVDAFADGDVVRIKQGGSQEGQISVSGATVTYAAFVGVHPSQPMFGQETPPLGGVLISNGTRVLSELTIWEEAVGTATKSTGVARITNPIRELIGLNPVMETIAGRVYKIRLPEEIEKDPVERAKFTKKVISVPEKEIYIHVVPTTTASDNRVYGVFVAQNKDNTRDRSFGENDVPSWDIASLGHYKVRVTDENGNISNGDYLCSSTRAYEAMKQDDDILHSHTIAKALVDVDFTSVPVDGTLGYKWVLVPATLHCG